jgi:hypothetical protein
MLLLLLACPAIDDQEHAARFDLDGDGVPWPEDCDDGDPDVSPLASEICDNGRDEDCDEDPRDCLLSGDLRATDAQVRIDGSTESYLGWTLGVADLDGDGQLDVAAGAPNLDQVALLRGPIDQQDASLVGDVDLVGPDGSAFGIDLAAVDGWLAVGAPGVDQVAVYQGLDPDPVALLDHGQVAGSTGFAVALDEQLVLAASAPLTSEERGEVVLVRPPLAEALVADMRVTGLPGERIGNRVALGDLDGDGVSELLISSTTAQDYGGQIWACEVDQVDIGTEDCQALALGSEGDYLGQRVLVRDLDQDGHADLLAGAGGVDGGKGAVGVFLGPLSGTTELDDADAQMLGMDQGDRMGSGLSTLDLDGDGRLEVLAGSLGGSSELPGRVALHEAPWQGLMDYEQALLRIEGPPAAGFGLSLGGGELTGEGRADVLVGAPLLSEAAGSLLLFRGEDI